MRNYIPQMLVDEIGTEGQKAISSAKVLIIGAGGLGIPLVAYLAGSGVGCLGLVDGDTVAESNLHRQFLYRKSDIGESKVAVLAQRLAEINEEVLINTYPIYLAEQNAETIIADYNIICDCTDNVDARILIAQESAKLQKPLVYAAVLAWQGYLTILNNRQEINLKDIFSTEQLKAHAQQSCSNYGIVGSVCGTLASMQATEVLKIILDLPSKLDGHLLCADMKEDVFRYFKLKSGSNQTSTWK